MSDYSIYPKAIDGFAQIPLAVDRQSPVNSEGVNRLRSGIINIENTLGVAPHVSGVFGEFLDVDGRVSGLEESVVGVQDQHQAMDVRIGYVEGAQQGLEADFRVLAATAGMLLPVNNIIDVNGNDPALALTFNLDDNNYTVLIDGGDYTEIVLPAAASAVGRVYVAKRVNSAVGVPKLVPQAGELIDGLPAVTFGLQWEVYTVQSDGAGWFVLSHF